MTRVYEEWEKKDIRDHRATPLLYSYWQQLSTNERVKISKIIVKTKYWSGLNSIID